MWLICHALLNPFFIKQNQQILLILCRFLKAGLAYTTSFSAFDNQRLPLVCKPAVARQGKPC